MNFVFDYSKDKQFEEEGFASPFSTEWDAFLALRPELCAPLYNEERADRFCDMVKYFEASARLHEACIKVTVQQHTQVGAVILTGKGFDFFSKEEDPTKAAFLLGLQDALSVHIRPYGDILEILFIVKLGA